jgi:flagellar basal-body rod modification protein FlgD
MWVNGVTASSTTSSATASSTLTGSDFLQLLVTQMSNQDPMNPMSNEDFSAQMAQFSSLQELQTANTHLGDQLTGLSLGLASGLIGKKITATDSETKAVVSGVVDSVSISGSIPYVTVAGTKVSVYDVTNIETVS